jgi:N-acetylglucosamine-6-phosphate deacetylase
MVRLTRCSLAEACVMASQTPAAFLGLEDQMGSIRTGHRADLVIMDSSCRVRSSIVAGQPAR